METKQMSDNTESTILLKLGEVLGLLKGVSSRLETAESNHSKDMENVTTRLNSHSDRLKAIEHLQATNSGEKNGKRAMLALLIMVCGLAAWWLANGLSLLQASAQ